MLAHESLRLYTLDELMEQATELMNAAARPEVERDIAIQALDQIRLIYAEVQYRTDAGIWVTG